jgi:hypothetical protein
VSLDTELTWICLPSKQARFTRVLKDWCPRFEGCHVDYPGGRQRSPAFSLVANALRRRARSNEALKFTS